MTRGIRNNNPLNIRFNLNNKWRGKKWGEAKKDLAFEEFDTMQNGIRAAIKLVRNYIKSGYDTPESIILRWCPPYDPVAGVENDTDRYLRFVMERLKTALPAIDKRTKIYWHDFDVIFGLISAMAWMESRYAVPAELFLKAWKER